jgi:hypothetical protein
MNMGKSESERPTLVTPLGPSPKSGEYEEAPPFEIGDELTIYEAATVYAGRHASSKFLSDATLEDVEIFLGRGSTDARRRLSWDVYCDLLRLIGRGEVEPLRSAYLPDGKFDPLKTVIRTADVAKLGVRRGDDPELLRGWARIEPPRKERVQPRAERVREAIAKSGMDISRMSHKELVAVVQVDLKIPASPDTILRAMGRKKRN